MRRTDAIERRRFLVASATGSVLGPLAGCIEDVGDIDDVGAGLGSGEPDDPPPGIYDESVSLGTIRDVTAGFLAEDAYEAGGWLTVFDDVHEIDGSEAMTAKAEPEAPAGLISAGFHDGRSLSGGPADGKQTDERYYDGDDEYRRTTNGETDYSSRSAEYADFVEDLEWILDQYYETGDDLFEFGAPEWDDDQGAYVVEAEGVSDPDEYDVSIDECEFHVDEDGVVVYILADLYDNEYENRIQTEIDVRDGGDVNAEAPGWIDDVGAGEDGNDAGDVDTDGWEHVDEIYLEGWTVGWEGVEPAVIEDETNPTLVLFEGDTYALTWENMDGERHNFEIRDSGGNTLEVTDLMGEEGETQSITFEATADMDQYICTPHPAMIGDIEVV